MKHLKRTRTRTRTKTRSKRRSYKKPYKKTYKKSYQRPLKGGWGVIMGNANSNANPFTFPSVSQKKPIIIGGWGSVAPI